MHKIVRENAYGTVSSAIWVYLGTSLRYLSRAFSEWKIGDECWDICLLIMRWWRVYWCRNGCSQKWLFAEMAVRTQTRTESCRELCVRWKWQIWHFACLRNVNDYHTKPRIDDSLFCFLKMIWFLLTMTQEAQTHIELQDMPIKRICDTQNKNITTIQIWLDFYLVDIYHFKMVWIWTNSKVLFCWEYNTIRWQVGAT